MTLFLKQYSIIVWLHLRSPNFRAIRDTMELRHPCELMCGIVLNSFPLHFDTVDMQRCMVAIELNARRLLDERRATRDDPLAHERETGTCYSHRKKRPTGVGPKTEWKAPETTHATPCLFSGWCTCPVRQVHSESLRSLIQGSGRLLGWPSVSKYVRIRIFGKLRVHAVTGLVLRGGGSSFQRRCPSAHQLPSLSQCLAFYGCSPQS